ncbi:type II and III secretion system protein [Bordetella bronchiseptica SBL-F6116]|nr:type II and III secretion system protein [Bordetella bronchiseptica SBL-F6116]
MAVLLAGGSMLWTPGGRAAPPAQPAVLRMEVGETQVLAAAGVTRVAVGNGQVLSATVVDGAEVALFARQPGTSSVHIWSGRGVRQAYAVEVLPAGRRRLREEVAALLARIPRARSSAVGAHIVIEGSQLSEDDHARIAALAQRYPEVLDFTGRVGWDRMVLLDVQVVELPRQSLRELGLRWGEPAAGGVHAGAVWNGGSAALAPPPGPLAGAAAVRHAGGLLGVNALLSARLSALAQRGEAVLLAQPQLLARSGATASFQAGGELPYRTTDKEGNGTTLFKPYGVSLQITPRIDADGAVHARIEVEASSVDPTLALAAGPALRKRRAVTEFNVHSGQTLVLGGFLSRERSHEEKGLPWLSELPLIGALFGARRAALRETELAIFVTPTIVSPSDSFLQRRALLGQMQLDQAFPEAPRLGTGAAADQSADWSRPGGAGSQWRRPPWADAQEGAP